MKVTVIGSWRDECLNQGWQLRHKNFFQPACCVLGRALLHCCSKLIVAHPDNPERNTADKYVADVFEAEGFHELFSPVQDHNRKLTWGAAHIDAVEEADAVIIIGGAEGSYSAGKVALLRNKLLIPIGCFGGAASELLHSIDNRIFPTQVTNRLSRLRPNQDKKWSEKLRMAIIQILQDYPKILIIHGRSDDRKKVKKIIQGFSSEFPGLPDPVIMRDDHATKSIPEKWEKLAAGVDAAIAVVTPDDLGAATVDEDGNPLLAAKFTKLTHRARENVWVEVGWFWGRLGTSRIMILIASPGVKFPTDLSSLVHHTYRDSPAELSDFIRSFIKNLRIGQRKDSLSLSSIIQYSI